MPITKGKPIEPYGKNLYSKNPRATPIKRIKNQTNKETNELKKYTLWVGGTEVTDHFVTYSKAIDMLKIYKEMGYTDVVIQEGR